MIIEKFRSRKMCLLLYPNEDITHKKAFEYIKNNYDCAYITHDKDYNEVGEIKKSHIHIVISFPNAKWNTAIAEEIGITPNYIQSIKNYEKCLEYLIHYNDDTKHQYSIDEVNGNLKKNLLKFIVNDSKDENDKTIDLLDFIDNSNDYISITSFMRYCASIGMYDVARRSQTFYLQALKEHNLPYL